VRNLQFISFFYFKLIFNWNHHFDL
jgi:hypothetical protein